MAEIQPKLYTWLRNTVVSKATRVVIKDDTDTEVFNQPATKYTWTHATKEVQVDYDQFGNKINETVPDLQTLTLEVVINGSDNGVSLPATFAKIELHDDFSGVLTSESFTPFEMTQAEDKITITHNIEVPKVTV